MSQSLTPKELAVAAAQGVAIALNSRTPRPEGITEEFFRPPIIVCGLWPGPIYEVEFNQAGGPITIGEARLKE